MRTLSLKPIATLAVTIGVVASACGGGEMTVPEYVDRLNAIVGAAVPQGEALFADPRGSVMADGADLSDFTPQDLQWALQQIAEIEAEVQAGVEAIDPPPAVAEFHQYYFDDRFASARAALALRAGSATSWEELSETPEMDAYRTAVAQDKQTCLEFQAEMDATSERGDFEDTPWIPGELTEVVTALLGCDTYPEHPEDMFRP